MLKFSNAPDFEKPRGQAMSDTNTNEYMVTVTAEAGGEMDDIMVTVTVDNVEEMGAVTLMPMAPVVGTEITADLTDPDMMVTDTTWQWSKSMEMDESFTNIDMATSMTYTPVEADEGYYLKATASYTDGHDSGKMAMATTTSTVPAADPLLVKYDGNNNGMIDKTEVITAIKDYFDLALTKAEVIQVIKLYFEQP